MLLLLTACRALVEDPPPVACAAGEVRVASTGAAYDDVGAALAAAGSTDTVCLGAGRWELGPDLNCEGALDWDTLTVTGAGASETTLVGEGDAGCYRLVQAEASTLTVRGLTLEAAPLLVYEGDATLEDVRVTGFSGDSLALHVRTRTFTLTDVTIDDNVVDYGAGFRLYGDGTLTDLVVEGNRFAAGYLGELSGRITWGGGRVEGNVRTGKDPGYDLIEVWDTVTVADVAFTDNVTNGPVLTNWGELTLAGATVTGNDTNFRGVLSTYGALTLDGGVVEANTGADGAVALYETATLSAAGVAFADNGDCAITGDGSCIDAEPTGTEDCTVAGCD